MKKLTTLVLSISIFAAAMSVQMPVMSAEVTAEEIPAGTYLIRNMNSGIYLDVKDGVAANGTNVQQWATDYGQAYNVWEIVPASGGYYYINSMLDGGDTYRLSTGVEGDASDISMCIWEKNNSDAQQYRFSANDDGSFQIQTKRSGCANVVEVINAETVNGADVQEWEINGASCQNWELIPISYTVEPLMETQSTILVDAVLPGDLNQDSSVNGIDLTIAKAALFSGEFSANQQRVGDVNGDGVFFSADLVLLQKFLLGEEVDFVKTSDTTVRKYAAVNGAYTQGVTETINVGFESESYLNLDNASGVTVSWNIAADSDGVYAVTFRYANGGTSSRNMKFMLNGALVYWEESFDVTGSWTLWQEVTVNLPLKQGVNQLSLTSLTEDGAPNLDWITVSATDEVESASKPIEPLIGIPNVPPSTDGRQIEQLDRGVVAAYTGTGMLVSWRSHATDAPNTTFKLYQNGNFIADIGADEATNYFVTGASASDSFTIDTYVNGVMTEFAQPATILGAKNSGQSGAYMDIALNKPADQTMPDGTTCSYMPNDCSVGDVDGDGQYEIIVKWDPSNSQDNSKDGYTGTVFLDCYRLDGTQLWRINLGINIRAGAHYTQFLVYDFDGDGKAELMCKTADGTYDGTGKVIGDASADYRSSAGRVLTGNEYLTLFDGETGAALDTIDYEPGRGNVSDWGDSYGNRVDRFLAGVAYLDGKTPSAVFCRGYYTRTAIVAYDVEDDKIVKRWMFDTGFDANNAYYGQGNHSLVTMDVDSDGKDEIVYGSCCIDDDGTGLWSTGLGHGDCMQAGDLIPERPGLEIFQVHEEVYCAEVHDAATGEILWRVDGTDDVGRGIALNLTADTPGMEFASVADGNMYAYNTATGRIEATGNAWGDQIKWSMNSAVWWDGDLEREALDRTMVEKVGPTRVFTGDGVTYNNASKSNACLTCDLFGDWREEIIFSTSDGNALRVFETTYATDVKLFTLMHDAQYRTGVAAENVGYNQAPNTSFFLGTGYALPETPQVHAVLPQE